MALRHDRYKFSRQVGVCRKTWETILSNQNSDARKVRPRISEDIFGLATLLLSWQFPPSSCQNASRDPPVNRGFKNPLFSWGLNAFEGDRIEPPMQCKRTPLFRTNFLHYCKRYPFPLRQAKRRSPKRSRHACLNKTSSMQVMYLLYRSPSDQCDRSLVIRSMALFKEGSILPTLILTLNCHDNCSMQQIMNCKDDTHVKGGDLV